MSLHVAIVWNRFTSLKGVKEHCYFLKEISDARGLRRAIVERFELASFPDISKEEKCRLLSFVVVGGGPTGNMKRVLSTIYIYM